MRLRSLVLGAEINKIKKNYLESQGRRNTQLKGLGEELQGVQKIMYDNIDAVLQRGELLSGQCVCVCVCVCVALSGWG